MGEIYSYLDNQRMRLLVLIIVIAFFIWCSYWFVVSVRATAQLILEGSFFIEQTKVGWWTAIFYATEVTPSAGVIFRWAASVLALYSALIFVKKGGQSALAVKRKVVAALFLEGANYLTMIPVVISGFTYPFMEGLWYYGETPGIVVFLLNGLATLAMVIVIPLFVFKLRSKIVHESPVEEIIKWSCLTGAAYLFVFWFVYSISWLASLVPWSVRAQPGVEILLNPLDMVSFLLTVFFLLVVMLYGWATLIPAARRQSLPSLRRVGVTMTGLGIYFAAILIIFFLFGGYHAHPTVWMEILGPMHNPDCWSISLIPLGLYLVLTSKNRR
jgi:hypothetical protein